MFQDQLEGAHPLGEVKHELSKERKSLQLDVLVCTYLTHNGAQDSFICVGQIF